MKIIYLHGFSSAGSTGTATEMRNHFYPLGISVVSPDIPIMPRDAVPFLQDFIAKEQPDLIIGTSMGAMYAELQKGYRRILVNPSFQMSRTLTFNHLGKNVDFQNPRQDGATHFKVDKEMITQFKELETASKGSKADGTPHVLYGITPEEKKLVWGLFGDKDRLVNFQKEFQKCYGKEHFKVIDAEHRLNSNVLKKEIIPLIHQILGV